MAKQRSLSLDITRVIAVLAVVMVHVSAIFAINYEKTTPEFLWGNLLDSVSRICVPLFVMVSGALMLDARRPIPLKTLLTKHVKNIAFLLLFWSVFYCGLYSVVIPLIHGEPIEVNQLLPTILLGHEHMWYLHMIIGLYLITPFLRLFVNEQHKDFIQLFFALSVATQFSQPILRSLSRYWAPASVMLTFIDMFYLDFFGGFITYYIAGWYFTHFPCKRKGLIYGLGACSLLITFVYVQFTKDYENGYAITNLFILLYAVAVFIALNGNVTKSATGALQRLTETLSRLSFGVYITHPILQTLFLWLFPYSQFPLCYLLVEFCFITVFAFAGCYIASKIPVIKKLIRA